MTKQEAALSPLTTRTINMMEVRNDLLRQHFEVYPASSPDHRCDLLILGNDNDPIRRVAIRTVTVNDSGRCHANLKGLHPNQCDMLALVLPDQEIVYIPDLVSGVLSLEVRRRLTPGFIEQLATILPALLVGMPNCEDDIRTDAVAS